MTDYMTSAQIVDASDVHGDAWVARIKAQHDALGSACPRNDEPLACDGCGSTETVELHHVNDITGAEQSITICAECGAD